MISYIGGKSLISKWIIPFIPNDIETYIECFGGMFWVFFKMDIDKYTNLKKIVYNDFNILNVNLFKCIKRHEKLLAECEKIPVQLKGEITPEICKENFYKFQSEIYDKDLKLSDDPDYNIAAKYIYVLTSVFSGSNPHSSKFIDLKGKYHSKFTSFMNKLKNEKWQKMFEKINVVENLDFEELITKYDSDNTYFYLDPPYYIVGEGNYYSNHSFTNSDHNRLANILSKIDGRFSLSYYHFDKLDEWYPTNEYRHESRMFSKAAGAIKGKKQSVGTELLIMNY